MAFDDNYIRVFKLRSAQLPARFRCKLDKGKFKGCGKNSKKGKKYKTPKLEPGKHKLVVQVVMGALANQGLRVASKCLWDTNADNYASHTYTTDAFYCTALVFGCYNE